MAIAVATVVTLIFLVLFVFTTYFATLVVFIMIALGAWAVVLAAGVVFPYKRPEIYEKSPISKRKVLGLPLMTVACSCGFVGAVFYFFTLFFDSFAAGHDLGPAGDHGGVLRRRIRLLPHHEGVQEVAGRRCRPRLQADPDRVSWAAAPSNQYRDRSVRSHAG